MAKPKIEVIRHSLSHIMAHAVGELFPGTKFGIGPTIENGFYYDFDLPKSLSEKDFPKIEKKMREIIKKNISFKKKRLSEKETKKYVKNQPYKIELIKELPKAKITFYESNDFIDLCQGPHVKSSKEINASAFKLTKVAGAYWRGDEGNPMLTRIYGVAFNTKKELDKHLHVLKEAKKRNHKKLGEKLELFFLSSVAPGMPFWMPKGMIIRNILFERWKKIQNKYGYKEVMAPNLLAIDVFKQSGHWEHYKDEMFFTQGKGKKKYALKPMDCPGEIMIYKHKMRSYKDLPIKYSEIGTVMRNEKSGELNGLFRVAQVTQDDAHIFMKEDQIKEQIKEVIKIAKEIYEPFDLEYKIYLATRPDDFMGSIKTWNKAEKILKQVMKESKLPVLIKEKDGAFYGPKIDYQAKDSLGRTWQCATIQLDFFMPEKFNLEYIGKDGKKHRPIMCHRAIMGSIERFMGILIEHYGGAFPLWLAPEQIWVIPVGKQHVEYAKKVAKNLDENNLRYQLKDENESVSKKIRNGEIQKIPYLLVVGDEEVKSKSIRARSKGKDLGKIKLTKFIEKAKIEIEKEK